MKPFSRMSLFALRSALFMLCAGLLSITLPALEGHAEISDERPTAKERTAPAQRGSSRVTRSNPRTDQRSEPRHDPRVEGRTELQREQNAVQQLLEEAEAAYREARWQVAFDAFKAVVALQPDHAQGWLRIGNLHQRRAQWLGAAAAYRKAADIAQRVPADASLRSKALLNLASVNLELAEAALSEAGSGSEREAAAVHQRAAQVSESLQSAFAGGGATNLRQEPPVVEYLRAPARP